ncbi:hypothetical protein NP233_g6462 [Leucocoprinus birnbaumii]|uniref:Uncharacterized protein n=1 Tax=Leucocoprinus birnbaumii TaxID=56174 RepID=A0AAD5VTA2_9AGAR|nr:hypothetical protein NP233_g6462 [Leucocoprinus birnbaumii]
MDIKNKPVSKSMGLKFTAALAAFGVGFYIAKRSVNSKRKADLDEYRASMNQASPQLSKDSAADTTNTGS